MSGRRREGTGPHRAGSRSVSCNHLNGVTAGLQKVQAAYRRFGQNKVLHAVYEAGVTV